MGLAEATGVYTIAATPFEPDGSLDLDSTDRMVEFYRRCGVHGMTILGVMGEAPKLDAAEALAFVRRVLARAEGLPVIVGVSAPGFASMRALARSSMEAGAAGVMIAPVPSARTDDQIVTYLSQACEAVGRDVPVVLQDFPQTTGVVMSVPVIRRIVEVNPQVTMLKHEDWPGLEKIATLRVLQADGLLRPFSILCGNGGLFLDFELSRGADGAMTGYAFPDMLVDLVARARAGDVEGAHDLFDAHLPLIRYEQQPGLGLAVRKHVLQKRGAITHATQRVPGSSLSAAAVREIDLLLRRLARRDGRAAGLSDPAA